MNDTTFHMIDQKNWAGAQSFYYYTQMAPTTYTINVKIPVTKTRNALKEKNMHFFPTYLYLVTKAMGEIKELRMAKEGEVLGYFEKMTPAYPLFHEDDGSTSLLWTEYSENFMEFYERYENEKKEYGNQHGILSGKGIPPKNTYTISCIPWFTFESFSLHNHGIKDYFFPSFEAGGFQYENEECMMPLSITVHHATTDGYHIKRFLEIFQNLIDHPQEWLNA